MLRVSLAQAVEGMSLALPLYHPLRPGVVLLRAGIQLDNHTIKRLWEMGLRDVWISYPALSFIADFVNPAVLEACHGITQQVADAFDRVLVDAHAKLDYPTYRRAIAALLEKLALSPKAGILVNEIVDGSQPALRHASNVCLVSVLMGIKLDFYLVKERPRLKSGLAQGVTTLGLGALLHDIGMLRLDPETLTRWNNSHDESDLAWREHTELGYRTLQGNIEPSAAAAVQHHHQHFDGSGFPAAKPGTTRGLTGSDIHIFARIVTAADLLDRLRNPADTHGAVPGAIAPVPTVRALKLMQQAPYSTRTDPLVLRALINVVPPFPPGSMVKITGGIHAVVADWHPEDPCRPTVVTIPHDGGRINPESAGGRKIDLRRHTNIQIIEIDGVDVRGDSFYPTRPGDYDLAKFALGVTSTKTNEASVTN